MNYSLGNMLGGSNGSLNPDKLSLDLQFATDKTLTARKGPTPVFTRASTATYYGPLINIAGYMLAIPTTGGITNGRAVWFKSDGELDVTIFYTGTQWKFTAQYPDDLYEFLATAGSEFRPDQANWFTSPVTSSSTFGLLTASINEPRFDHDPITLDCKGLLIEESRTNLITWSEEMSTATGWSEDSNRILWVNNATTSPAGTTTAEKITELALAGVTRKISVKSVPVVTGTTYTLSVYAKAAERSFLQITASANFTSAYQNFDLSNGTIGSGNATSSAITAMGNGWYRCSIVAPASATANGTITVGIVPASTSLLFATYQGADNHGIFLWGAQLEAGSFPTSYIPTTTSALTRSVDVCSITGSAFAGFYNQSEGTLFANIQSTGSGDRRPVALDVGNNSQAYWFYSSTAANRYAQASGSLGSFIMAGTVPSAPLRYAGTIKDGDYSLALNGSIVGSSLATLGRTDISMRIGSGAGGGGQFLCGHLAAIRYYKKRLANAKLQTLTQLVSDADANAYITSLLSVGAAVTPTQQDAINTFVKAGKADGWYSSLKRLYLPIWASAAPNAVDMITRASGTFNGTVTHSAGYVQGDGSTGYFNTNIAPSAVSGLSTSTAYTFGLLKTELPNLGNIGRSRNSASQDWNLVRLTGNLSSSIMANIDGSGLLGTATTFTGILSGSRVDGTRFNARRISASRTNLGSVTDADFGSVPTLDYYFMAGNSSGTAIGLSTTEFGSFGFGLGLTDTQDNAFTLALKNLWETCTSLTLP
jgi:hypothetical protein